MTTSDERSCILATDEYISADGTEIHLCQNGPRDAPALLLIHGTGASVRSWEPMLPLLSAAHRVIRVDLPGCGASPAPKDGNYTVTDLARRLAAVLDELVVESMVVVGHSSGGTFATALTEARPELVDAVVLINTGPQMSAYIAQDVDGRMGSWAELTDDQIRAAIGDGFRPGFAIPKDYVDQFRDIDIQAFGALSVAIRSYLDERALPERLAPLRRPLQVIFGDQDQRWRPSSATDYGMVPGALIEMMPGLGHSPNLEDPQRTAAVLVAFTGAVRADDR